MDVGSEWPDSDLPLWVAWAHPADGFELLQHATRRFRAGSVNDAAAWAMGELGDPRAADVLDSLSRVAPIHERAGLLQLLGRSRPYMATMRALDEIETPGLLDACGGLQYDCRIGLLSEVIRHGDEACLPRLRALAHEFGAEPAWHDVDHAWHSAVQPDFEPMIWIALAACDDVEARQSVLGSIRTEGHSLTADATRGLAWRPGESPLGIPNSFWPGVAITEDRLDPWGSLQFVKDALRGNPSVFADLIHEVLSDSLLPDLPRLILLSQIEQDAGTMKDVRAIWRRSRRPIALRLPLISDSQSASVPELVNVNACAVAHLLGRWNDAPALLEFVGDRVPEDRATGVRAPDEGGTGDRVLEGEIAFALARTGDAAALPWLLDYVTRVWHETAGSPEFDSTIVADSLGGIAGLTRPARLLDRARHAKAVSLSLATHLDDPSAFAALVENPALHPAVRVHCMGMGAAKIARDPTRLATARRVLDSIEHVQDHGLIHEWTVAARYQLNRAEARLKQGEPFEPEELCAASLDLVR